ncbi:Na+/H+ antiporter subunit E [Xanthobacter sp. V4C-4]|uniref:Na+/H+ antiporter subunit E n=1 Tax=Xanthobacter cornucopiae TaxID=3119924 RepID=UPI0037284322
MSRILPHPLLFLALLAMWLLLNQSLSPGQIILGSAVAYAASWTLSAFNHPPSRLRRPSAMVRLALRVLADIFRSNLAVGRIILAGTPPSGRSGFMTIPLDLRDRNGLALLAIILTATPGTLWMNYDAAKGELLLHVLDLVDEAHWVELIKHRYERLLMEIFE